MASKRLSIEEQIEKKEESIKQLQNQKRQLKKKLNEQERKARNKRLIEKGAVFESIFEESIDLTKDEFYKKFQDQVNKDNEYREMMKNKKMDQER
ncbi:ATP-dependent exoDNAse (exonuclease V) subunit alpha [Streptococcus pneumoniae]|nr:ATP-dependent exoDNAse (exonuclease V) subunit alpha [Streptococcus pneumoniae]CAG6108370.1 ATP-dependent exoDNAse (exonuclease V) subunit alpha [Streptococcus pneumoniae]CAG6110224.1 ATP-dependent exoDNAse (exonuclease V) subunit alpha [Streptococcus pneumoniae]CAG6126117.1 ATP-dependent exoDNAse (exonuclease V) subunit alpha [Streptococcus pneumoniae]CAG6189934.1 ATP-dependent exoDNAse (exonuclease V) subunit alpha [Streptococcus pneumoniae]